jgi:hypothetical protein
VKRSLRKHLILSLTLYGRRHERRWEKFHEGGAMGGRAGEARRADEWGPVCRGYQVLLPDGQRGSVEDILVRGDQVELIVATGLFVHRHLTVAANDIEAILPAACRLVVRGSDGAAAANGAKDVETVGGILRMPVLHSLRPGSVPEGRGVVADPVSIAVDNGVAGAGLVRCLARHGLAAGLV